VPVLGPGPVVVAAGGAVDWVAEVPGLAGVDGLAAASPLVGMVTPLSAGRVSLRRRACCQGRVYASVVKVNLTAWSITGSARRHAIPDPDINHAWEHALRFVEYEYDGDERLLVIGPSRSGALLELVFYDYLR
jgi:hypothetical protein